MKVTKLPSGNYRARAYLGTDANGKPIQKSFTHPDKKTAVAIATQYENENRNYQDAGTLDNAMTRFMIAKSSSLAPSTRAEYNSRMTTLRGFYGALCHKRLISITEDDLRALVDDMRTTKPPRHAGHKEPKPLSPKTIKNYLLFLSAVFRFSGIQMPKVDVIQTEIPDLYIPTDHEIKILIQSVKDTPLYVPVLLAAFGPLRRGEICALRLDDFDGNVVHVRRAVSNDGKNLIIKSPKTRLSNRFIDLPGFVVDAVHTYGLPELTPDQISARFPHALTRADLPLFRFHDLRHWCVSTLHAQGVSDASIMRRGGWSTDATLKRVYRHTLADQDAIQNKRANDHFSAMFNS